MAAKKKTTKKKITRTAKPLKKKVSKKKIGKSSKKDQILPEGVQEKNQNQSKENVGAKSFLSTIVIIIITLLLALVIAHVFSLDNDGLSTSRKSEDIQQMPLPITKDYELNQTDIFSLQEWNALQVTVNGVSLGDSLETIETLLGKPDNVRVHQKNVITVEYYKDNNKDEVRFQFFMINNQVRRIMVQKSFNENLMGTTKIEGKFNLTQIFRKFGSSDEQELLEGTIRIIEYHDVGLELYYVRNEMKAFALVPPGLDGGQSDELKPLSSFA